MQRRVQVRSTDAHAVVCSANTKRKRERETEGEGERERFSPYTRIGAGVFIFLAEIRRQACPGSREGGESPVGGDALNVKYGRSRGWDDASVAFWEGGGDGGG